MEQETAVIIGAGPAGLTAALELQRQTGIKPIVIEASHEIGGLSQTVKYKGNRMDIGGHRFFSKSDRVMQWWLELMPVESGAGEGELRYQGQRRDVPAPRIAPKAEDADLVMLVRQRKSRIYYLRRFFDYPIKLTADTLRKMGAVRTMRAGLSYMKSALLPQRKEVSLEDFLINRFGTFLYQTFFESYTEKVWGVPCNKISAEWGAQRIKGLSLKAVAVHFLRKTLLRSDAQGLSQKKTETSLIERFLYPKLGPGQLWEHVAELIQKGGGEFHFGFLIDRIHVEQGRVQWIECASKDGERMRVEGDYFFSTMPVRDLIVSLTCEVPEPVRTVSNGLIYRDFITVGVLVKGLRAKESDGSALKDNWIYVQEPDVMVGRLQIFNNWSPWLVEDQKKTWIGLEYFCNETDPLWSLPDAEMADFAIGELAKIGIIAREDVEDFHVVHMPKTYPAYFGTYDRFDVIREFTDGLENLFLVGRNGMHKYNNQDHSMLTAMTAVENIAKGITTKDNIWSINTEMEYHEEKESK